MDINDFKEETDLTIDEWIDLFKYKVKNADTDQQASEYSDALDFFNDAKIKMVKLENATITDDLVIHVKMIYDSFNAVFDTWECEVIQEDAYIILTNDVVCLEISDIDAVECLVSFNKDTNPVLASEIAVILNNIFGSFLHINNDMFIINPLNNNYIWGEEDIQRFVQSQPRKLNPIIYFGNEGNA